MGINLILSFKVDSFVMVWQLFLLFWGKEKLVMGIRHFLFGRFAHFGEFSIFMRFF
jgi:hypothetical protein